MIKAKKGTADLTIWCDGSKLDRGETGAAVVWRNEENSMMAGTES